LSSAATTGPQWGQSFSYDGFGNMLSTVVTKGSAPSVYLYPDPTNNRLGSGYQWDANGNMTAKTATPTLNLTYDVENRMVQAVHSMNGTERYVYDPSNQRVWKQEPSRTLVYFYGIEGNLLATYGDQSNTDYNVYFGGKLIWAEASPGLAEGPLGMDRLGSVVSRNGTSNRYFPYGEEPAATGQDRTKFATYHRDQTTALDYAQNRYYSSAIARFTTSDPYIGSVNLAQPVTWNRYTYVRGDPVNFKDPSGRGDEGNFCTFYPDHTECDPLPRGRGEYSSMWSAMMLWDGPPSPGYSTEPFFSDLVASASLQSAIDTAVEALLKDDCASLFGGANPIGVLYELQRGDTSWGTIGFAELGEPAQGRVYSAQTVGILTPSEGVSMFSGVTISINISNGAPWSNSYADTFGIGNAASRATQDIYRAMTLIHELGHAFNIITGLGWSQIQQDIEDPALSEANTRLVYEHCFK
jgi:RHS repeat-associated protein